MKNNRNESAELHPCRFCGYERVRIHALRTALDKYVKREEHFSAHVRCPRCHARGPVANVKIPLPDDGPSKTVPEEVELRAARLWNEISDTKGENEMKTVDLTTVKSATVPFTTMVENLDDSTAAHIPGMKLLRGLARNVRTDMMMPEPTRTVVAAHLAGLTSAVLLLPNPARQFALPDEPSYLEQLEAIEYHVDAGRSVYTEGLGPRPAAESAARNHLSNLRLLLGPYSA